MVPGTGFSLVMVLAESSGFWEPNSVVRVDVVAEDPSLPHPPDEGEQRRRPPTHHGAGNRVRCTPQDAKVQEAGWGVVWPCPLRLVVSRNHGAMKRIVLLLAALLVAGCGERSVSEEPKSP